MKLLAWSLALVAMSASVARAEITLGVLSQCEDLNTAYTTLKETPQDCGTAPDSIERALAQHVQGGAGVCFLAKPPTNSLTSFHCMVVSRPGIQRTLFCERPSDYQDVLDYQASYLQKWAAPVKRYLDAADACPVGTGGAAAVGQTPALTAWVVKMDFGFLLALGSGLVGQSTVIDGYGQVDPVISGEDHAEVEFIEMYVILK